MGGRGAKSGKQIGTMGGGSMGAVQGTQGPVTFQMKTQPPHTVATPQQAVAANNAAFPDTDSSSYHQLFNGRKYYQKQNLTVSQQMAAMDYIDPNTVPGSLYAASQNLNTAMVEGHKLTAQQEYMKNMLLSSMHNMGYNTLLTRYDHSAFLNDKLAGTGLDMNTASVDQIKAALVGKKFRENRFLSSSYNNFKNAPSGNPFTDRQVKITYQTDAGTQVMMPGDTTDRSGRKLSWGEVVVSPMMQQEFIDIKEISKNGGRKKGSPAGVKGARQLEIIIRLSK